MLHHHDAFPDATLRAQHLDRFHCGECCQQGGIHWHFGNAKDLTGRTVFPEDQLPIDVAAFASSTAQVAMAYSASDVFDSLNATISIQHLESIEFSLAAQPLQMTGPCDFPASVLMDAPLVAVTGVCLV